MLLSARSLQKAFFFQGHFADTTASGKGDIVDFCDRFSSRKSSCIRRPETAPAKAAKAHRANRNEGHPDMDFLMPTP